MDAGTKPGPGGRRRLWDRHPPWWRPSHPPANRPSPFPTNPSPPTTRGAASHSPNARGQRGELRDPRATPGDRRPQAEPTTKDDLLALFDKNADEFLAHLRKATEAQLEGRWVMTFGGQPFVDGPRHDALRTWAISHMIHHRAQLTAYRRLMGAKVPGCYGPTADDAPPAG